MTYLHNRGIGPIVSSQKMSHELDRFLGRRETDACQALASQMIEAFQRKRQMGTAFVVSYGMDFIHDDRVNGPQDFAALRRSKEDVERFRSSYQNMRRTRQHGAALMRERIAGPHRGTNLRHQDPALPGELQDFSQRNFQVFLNVIAQRLER
jgi:hypothetical protein